MVLTGNSMGSSEIWDKYHECCIITSTNLTATDISSLRHWIKITKMSSMMLILQNKDEENLLSLIRNHGEKKSRDSETRKVAYTYRYTSESLIPTSVYIYP